MHASKSGKVSSNCCWQKKAFEKLPVFNFESLNIICEEVVKLLGIDIDFNLSFDHHISYIYTNAAQQLNASR